MVAFRARTRMRSLLGEVSGYSCLPDACNLQPEQDPVLKRSRAYWHVWRSIIRGTSSSHVVGFGPEECFGFCNYDDYRMYEGPSAK